MKNSKSLIAALSLSGCILICSLFWTQNAFAQIEQDSYSNLIGLENNPALEVNADSEEQSIPEESPASTALKAGIRAATVGPAKVPLLDQGVLNLPKNYLFIPMKEAADYMNAIGNKNSIGPEFLGLVIPEDDFNWFIVIDYIKSGYIKEDDAKNWNKDDLLQNIKRTTKKSNEDRIANGFKPIEIVGWIEPPTYAAPSHQLIWSMLAKDDSPEATVNYNTYVLGREGYFQLDLVTSDATISSDKRYIKEILASLNYNKNKRYEDFTAGKDHIAEYGLAALITGVVAKKLGWIALAGIFFAKVWKFLILIPMLFWGTIKKLLKKLSN